MPRSATRKRKRAAADATATASTATAVPAAVQVAASEPVAAAALPPTATRARIDRQAIAMALAMEMQRCGAAASTSPVVPMSPADRAAVQRAYDQVVEQFVPLTTEQIEAYQRSYAATPARLWLNTPDPMRCDADPAVGAAVRIDPAVWAESARLGAILAPATPQAMSAALAAIASGAIDLRRVDCYLPVITGATPCAHCAPRIGSGAGVVPAVSGAANDKQDSPQPSPAPTRKSSIVAVWLRRFAHYVEEPLSRLFREVLLPCGLASRYNEPVDCTGLRAYDRPLAPYHAGERAEWWCEDVVRDQAMLLAALPLEGRQRTCPAALTVSPRGTSTIVLETYPEQYETRSVTYPNVAFLARRMADIAAYNTDADALETNVREALRSILPPSDPYTPGRIAASAKRMSVTDIVLAYALA